MLRDPDKLLRRLDSLQLLFVQEYISYSKHLMTITNNYNYNSPLNDDDTQLANARGYGFICFSWTFYDAEMMRLENHAI